MAKIFVALSTFARFDPEPLALLERSGHTFSINSSGARLGRAELIAQAHGAEGVIAGVEPYDSEVLAALTALRCIARCGAGVDNVDLTAAVRRRITVVNTPDVPTQAVAELAVALMLALSRDLVRQHDLMRARRWERVDARLLAGRMIGIVGFGRIGRRVAELLAPFRVRLVATDPRIDEKQARELAVSVAPLPEVLRAADIVTIHAGETAAVPLIGEKELSMMRPTARILNLARGELVDHDALVRALKTGKLAGAALDVYSEEPYRGELCDLPNVILTPHSATLTRETRAAMEKEAVDKLLRCLAGTLRPYEKII